MTKLKPGSITKLPSHPQPQLDWQEEPNKVLARGMKDSFTYIAPVVKYSPAGLQPGPVYRGGEAAAIGHQPFNYTDAWTAYSQPHVPNLKYMQMYKGSQSAASYAVAQNAIALLLAQRSNS